ERNKRELHLDRANQVTSVPHELTQSEGTVKKENGLHIEKLIEAQSFSVYHWHLDGEVSRELREDFLQVSLNDGEASIRVREKSFQIQKGQHFIIPYGVKSYELEGKVELVVSHV